MKLFKIEGFLKRITRVEIFRTSSLSDDDSVIIGSWFEEPSTPGGEDTGQHRGSAGRSSAGVRARGAWAAAPPHTGAPVSDCSPENKLTALSFTYLCPAAVK